MRTYEVMVIAQPDLDEQAINALVEKVKGWITEKGGSVENVDNWGRRRMAYVIKKQREGQYILITAKMEPSFTSELERNLRFIETVVRFMITVVE